MSIRGWREMNCSGGTDITRQPADFHLERVRPFDCFLASYLPYRHESGCGQAKLFAQTALSEKVIVTLPIYQITPRV